MTADQGALPPDPAEHAAEVGSGLLPDESEEGRAAAEEATREADRDLGEHERDAG